MIIVEYIWLGGNKELRSKTKVFQGTFCLENLPEWNYDGSSTGQAIGSDSEIILKPRAVYKCPFRGDGNYIVMCDTYNRDGTPTDTNKRVEAVERFNKKLEEEPWYGIEQEYFIINPDTGKPLGFPFNGLPNPQGQYYCSVGYGNAYGRELVEEHLSNCVYAGLNISGINAEVAPGQWEYQIGPCTGIDAGDQLWISRYILLRVAEKYGYSISFHPKPMSGDWNGSGCHTNYSTKAMREGVNNITGLEVIDEAILKLEKKHSEHMKVYGNDNNLRMTGLHETSGYDTFSCGRANRGCSIRIPNNTIKEKRGYFEDRRPASNMDPYEVTSIIFETTCL